jgi:preprotein translocase subunit SecF
VPEHNAMILRFKTQQSDADRRDVEEKLKTVFASGFPDNPFVFERVEFVGPVVGRSLWGKALMAIFFSFFGIVIYVAFRFKNWIWGFPAFLRWSMTYFWPLDSWRSRDGKFPSL